MNQAFIPSSWIDYELLDTGEGMKLERWKNYIMARPDPRIIWAKGNLPLWETADATFIDDKWNFKNHPPQDWVITYKAIKFRLKPTDFKHTGVFPEQAVNWDWLPKAGKVLNLFAYTGGATIAAALQGAQVTHVDSSKPALSWARENAALSGIAQDKIRWIPEDALRFVQREVKREAVYDGIIMDPPRFGRGASGEVWKLEESLPKLVQECKKLLSPSPTFFLINAYTADLSSTALGNLLADVLDLRVEFGELGLKETSQGRILPAGIFARWKS